MDPLVAGSYARALPPWLDALLTLTPWDAAHDVGSLLLAVIGSLPDDFVRVDDLAVHRGAVVDPTAIMRGPVVIDDGAVVGPHVVLRDGVYLGAGTSVGSSVEVKSSWVFEGAALAHLNYVGNSVVGHDVNIEAGAVIANHFNERNGEDVSVRVDDAIVSTGRAKFGAAIGPGARIGANAVTTPGTLLAPGAIVGRLELIDQVKSGATASSTASRRSSTAVDDPVSPSIEPLDPTSPR